MNRNLKPDYSQSLFLAGIHKIFARVFVKQAKCRLCLCDDETGNPSPCNGHKVPFNHVVVAVLVFFLWVLVSLDG